MGLVDQLSHNVTMDNYPLLYNFEGRMAQLTLIKSTQTNGYDCGMWILACYGCHIRGVQYHSVQQAGHCGLQTVHIESNVRNTRQQQGGN